MLVKVGGCGVEVADGAAVVGGIVAGIDVFVADGAAVVAGIEVFVAVAILVEVFD